MYQSIWNQQNILIMSRTIFWCSNSTIYTANSRILVQIFQEETILLHSLSTKMTAVFWKAIARQKVRIIITLQTRMEAHRHQILAVIAPKNTLNNQHQRSRKSIQWELSMKLIVLTFPQQWSLVKETLKLRLLVDQNLHLLSKEVWFHLNINTSKPLAVVEKVNSRLRMMRKTPMSVMRITIKRPPPWMMMKKRVCKALVSSSKAKLTQSVAINNSKSLLLQNSNNRRYRIVRYKTSKAAR